MSYAPECYKLACDFLMDHPDKDSIENRHELAQQIQFEIEDVINELKPNKSHNEKQP